MSESKLSPPRGWKVLVVDHDSAALDRFAQVLGTLGCELVGLTSPFGATNAAVEHGVHVVILDARLPGLSGPGLWATMRDRVGPRTGVVFSSDDAEELSSFQRRFPESGVVTKPVSAEALQVALVAARRLARE